MSRAALESIAAEWISLWCTPVDWSLFDRLHDPEFEDHSSPGRLPTKEGFAAGLADLVEVFPDLKASVEALVVDEAQCRISRRRADQPHDGDHGDRSDRSA